MSVFVLTLGFAMEGERRPYDGDSVFASLDGAVAAGNCIAEEYGWLPAEFKQVSNDVWEREFADSYLKIRKEKISP